MNTLLTIAETRQQASDLVGSGDPNRSIVVMLTPFKLAVLHMHLANYVEALKDRNNLAELLNGLGEIQDDVQRTVTQILQSQYPPT